MHPYEHLTYKERIARVGALLAKGVSLMLLHEEEARRQAEASAQLNEQHPHLGGSIAGLDDEHDKVLAYLQRVGKASPRDMQDGLEISKATLFRRLSELQVVGLVTRTGRTTGVRYQLAPEGVAMRNKTTKGTAVLFRNTP